jgi:KUP system potassium uptake protein
MPGEKYPCFHGVIKAMGLVFCDIGTSPIYTLTVLSLLVTPSLTNIIGIISLIIWTLTILGSVQFAFLAMHLGYKGEGGSIVLKKILIPLLKGGRSVTFVSLLSIIGLSLIIGECVITPAISILSAVEGFRLVPGIGRVDQAVLVVIAAIITIGLFYFQKKGTKKVAGAFGPVMIAWFLTLAVTGLVSLVQAPGMLGAVNPLYIVQFFAENWIAGFFILSQVVLCATGGEALFADIGHLGRILREAGTDEKVIFYGMEEIVSDNVIWKIFYAIKRLSPSFVLYKKLPPEKIHGVVTRVEL